MLRSQTGIRKDSSWRDQTKSSFAFDGLKHLQESAKLLCSMGHQQLLEPPLRFSEILLYLT